MCGPRRPRWDGAEVGGMAGSRLWAVRPKVRAFGLGPGPGGMLLLKDSCVTASENRPACHPWAMVQPGTPELEDCQAGSWFLPGLESRLEHLPQFLRMSTRGTARPGATGSSCLSEEPAGQRPPPRLSCRAGFPANREPGAGQLTPSCMFTAFSAPQGQPWPPHPVAWQRRGPHSSCER